VSITAPRGFVATGGSAGIKAAGASDLALVATSDGASVPSAAVFTANLAPAAPVQVSREHLRSSAGQSAGVVLTSGNANAATGEPGRVAARRLCELSGRRIGAPLDAVLVCQTGLIGVPFPLSVVEASFAQATQDLGSDRQAGERAARAILTTDTVRKEVTVEGAGFSVGGMAKGAAMLAPNMATMLAVLTTDAAATPDELSAALRHAVAVSFNAMTVDGCTSTNDTVVVLASGRAGPVSSVDLAGALAEAAGSLAAQMVGDAEGATKVVHVVVRGAATDGEAHTAARKVADSLLVKCSLNGEDPYWGRVLSELATAGVVFDPDRCAIAYGSTTVCRDGVAADHDTAAVAAHMAGRHIEIIGDLGVGDGTAVVLGTDLGAGYLDENRTTS
jgi:glutamate N-acetyltransferase / amino-acid N-acetyltransferase